MITATCIDTLLRQRARSIGRTRLIQRKSGADKMLPYHATDPIPIARSRTPNGTEPVGTLVRGYIVPRATTGGGGTKCRTIAVSAQTRTAPPSADQKILLRRGVATGAGINKGTRALTA